MNRPQPNHPGLVLRDRWTDLGIGVVGLAAAATSWVGWTGLAERCGFTSQLTVPPLGIPLHLSWMLPVAVDVYALTTSRVWLRVAGLSTWTRSYARANALGAVAVSVGGNATYHWLAAEGPDTRPAVWLVVVVASIAPLMLGLVAHLAALIAEDHRVSGEASEMDADHPVPPDEFVVTEELRGAVPDLTDQSRDSLGQATARMRHYWDHERQAGRLPTAAELEQAAGVVLSDGYARRKRRQWLQTNDLAQLESRDSPGTMLTSPLPTAL